MSEKYKRVCKDCRLPFMASSFQLQCDKCNRKFLDKILENADENPVLFIKETQR